MEGDLEGTTEHALEEDLLLVVVRFILIVVRVRVCILLDDSVGADVPKKSFVAGVRERAKMLMGSAWSDVCPARSQDGCEETYYRTCLPKTASDRHRPRRSCRRSGEGSSERCGKDGGVRTATLARGRPMQSKSLTRISRSLRLIREAFHARLSARRMRSFRGFLQRPWGDG